MAILSVSSWLVSAGFFLLSAVWAQANYCSGFAELKRPSEKRHVEATALIESKLQKFANSPISAAKADELLSKLITKKSPLVDRWMERNSLHGQSEVEIVKKWRRYYLDTQLSEFPPPETSLQKPIADLLQELASEVFPKKLRSEWEELFLEAQKLALLEIKSWQWQGREAEQKKALARISAIQLVWLDAVPERKEKKSPLEFLGWSVAYDPLPNVVNIGVDALHYASKEILFAVFAHEIAHALDSCRWSAFFSGAHPQDSVLSCLRSDESVAAKTRDDRELERLRKSGKLPEALFVSLKENPTCNKSEYPPQGVQADQILEAFADWFSAQVLARSKYRNSPRRDLCEAKELRPGSSYPTNQARLERIYLAHPLFRPMTAQSGGNSGALSEKAKYCAPELKK